MATLVQVRVKNLERLKAAQDHNLDPASMCIWHANKPVRS